ncbi:hypothetical protein GU926_08340 [Nibribacter ruber]|uniref:Nucleotidyltransferase n=1 Tax=Nibribacter ruber TaxID=2698458 RepID=A0A6P1NZ94_9BACT|nr:hypothetical protein [Nibribacter ruber]QHL87445.1 hypothetical protein GU926_08340 [Nibribacter ruber]
MQLAEARRIAEWFTRHLRESCLRIEVAGSIRREKPEVNDIELVAIPRYETLPAPTDFFGVPSGTGPMTNMLYEALRKIERVQWIKPNTTDIIEWPLKPTAKWFKGYIPSKDLKIDIFTATRENWGLIYAIRTGSAEFSHQKLACQWVKYGFHSKGGTLYKNGKPFPVPEEKDLFNIIKMPILAPQLRF